VFRFRFQTDTLPTRIIFNLTEDSQSTKKFFGLLKCNKLKFQIQYVPDFHVINGIKTSLVNQLVEVIPLLDDIKYEGKYAIPFNGVIYFTNQKTAENIFPFVKKALPVSTIY